MGTEHIRDARLDSFRHIIFRIHIHPLFTAKRAQVVQSADMVVMFVRDQDRIQVIRLVADHLPTEIRAAIQQDPLTIRLHQYGRTQTPIPFIRAGAYLTLTTNFRYFHLSYIFYLRHNLDTEPVMNGRTNTFSN